MVTMGIAPGKDSYIRLPDWSDGVTSVNAKKKKKKKTAEGMETRKHCTQEKEKAGQRMRLTSR